MRSPWARGIPLAIILAGAAALRFWGIGWGLPNSLHSYSYHPDEFLTLGAAGMILYAWLPGFYNYPSFYPYLAALAITIGSAYGVTGEAGPYLCARIVTALMGAAAVAVTYWACRRVLRTRSDVPPILAALILCIAPLHVQHSHFATVDVPSTLVVAACLGFAGLVLDRGSWRDYILCGIMAGLAAGTKYNAGLVVLALIAAHFLGSKERDAGARRLLAGLACAALAFVASTPGIILQWSSFRAGFIYEVIHSSTGHGLVFAGTGNGFLYTFTHSLWYGLGPALAILFAIAALYGLFRLDRKALTILAFALPYYALISLSQVRFARYSLPLFPAAAILIAWMVADIWRRLSPEQAEPVEAAPPVHWRVLRWALAGLLALSLAGTLLYTIALDRLFVQPAPQDRAARWIFANIPKGSEIGVIEVPWFYSPPYSKNTGLGTLEQRRDATTASPYRLQVFSDYDFWAPWNIDLGTQWIVLSDYEIDDAQRLRGCRQFPEAERARIWRLNTAVDWIRHNYVQRKRFANNISDAIWLGDTRGLPHDMRYPAPTIWIYQRKASAPHPPQRLSDSEERLR